MVNRHAVPRGERRDRRWRRQEPVDYRQLLDPPIPHCRPLKDPRLLAGHIVLAVILGFIAQATGMMTWIVTPASLFGGVALSLLELFVAFLQAYIFTFLAALFIGSAAHPH